MNPVRMGQPATWFGLLALGVGMAIPGFVNAQMESARRYSQDDIEIRVDQEWTRPNAGGYFPVMMTVKNRGPDAALRIYTAPDQSSGMLDYAYMPEVEKRIELAQNATTQMTFLVPTVSRLNMAFIRVEKNGRRLDQIDVPVRFANEIDQRSFLVVDENIPNTGVFERYCQTALGVSGYATNQVVRRLPGNMPDTWLAYSGIDAVFIDAGSFANEMQDATRSELLRWVSSGGVLLIYNYENQEKSMRSVDDAIQAANWTADANAWKTFESHDFTSRDLMGYDNLFKLKLKSREFFFGKLLAMEKSPFDFGKLDDSFMRGGSMGRSRDFRAIHPAWDHIFSTIGTDSSTWLRRHGFSPRSLSIDFLQFLNLGIQKIPTWGFISLITLFAIVIGPVNYLLLKRRNKVSQMLWTTPLIALLTSLLLFGWSSIANGTGSHVRLRSVSILDQSSQSMVSHSRIAMFSGAKLQAGLRFEPHSAVYPVWQEDGSFKTGSVDWTNAQEISGSFHRGNSRSQFFVQTPRTERGRLQPGSLTENGLSVTNGLEWDIEQILVRDHSGRYFTGKRLDAGDSATLTPAGEPEIQAIRHRIGEQKLELPQVRPPPSSTTPNRFGRFSFESDPASSARFATGQMERKFVWFSRELSSQPNKLGLNGENIDHGLPLGSYLAVLSDNPGIDIGLEDYQLTEALHVLLGMFE